MREYVKIKDCDLIGSDIEIKENAKKYANGEYCIKICRGCGMYFHGPDGDTNTAKIINQCKQCFKEK